MPEGLINEYLFSKSCVLKKSAYIYNIFQLLLKIQCYNLHSKGKDKVPGTSKTYINKNLRAISKFLKPNIFSTLIIILFKKNIIYIL